ncbi:MAG TPA: hypothetical protein VG165_01695, partial [Solirubrobacteraceae bacterium]|nr:hypothetical protein [Solirubrobacteraceae bacterium]
PEGGYEPFGLTSLLAVGGATAALIALLPPGDRLLRRLGWLYLASLLLAYVVRSPIGSNAVRFGVLFVPAAVVGRVGIADVQRTYHTAARALPGPAGRLALGRREAGCVLGLLTAAIVAWQVDGPIDQSVGAAADPAARYGFYVPAINYLESRAGGRPVRIEVPFTSDHWDATILAGRFLLARGWERQLDTRYDALFYAPTLSAGAYRAWLLDNAVSFVALSTGAPDFSSVQEYALIRRGLPYLRLVDESTDWRIYAVAGARPLAAGPGFLTAVGADNFRLRASHAGRFVVRLHYTPDWSITAGAASVGPAPGGWTAVDVTQPGTVTVDADLASAVHL